MLLNLVSLIHDVTSVVLSAALIEKVRRTGQVTQWSIDYNTLKDSKSSGGLSSVPGLVYCTQLSGIAAVVTTYSRFKAEINAH
jgi:hypothetical protein